jgi:hypothetical protein
MAAHRAWRARTLSSAGAFVAWSEQEQRSAIGGADLTGVTGAAIQDSNFSGLPAANAFDNNINTLWACNGTGVGSYLGWDYGATVGDWKDIVQFALTTRNDGSWGQNAGDIAFDYSDDLVNWTESWRNTGIAWTGAGQTKTFSAPAPIVGLDSSKIEDVAWLDPPAGLDASKLAAAAWLDGPAGLGASKLDALAWLDPDGLRSSKLAAVAWLDAPPGLDASALEAVAWLDRPQRRSQLQMVN